LGLDLSFEIFDIVLLKEIASFHRSFCDSTSCELIDKSLDNFLRLEPEVESHPSKFVDLRLSQLFSLLNQSIYYLIRGSNHLEHTLLLGLLLGSTQFLKGVNFC